MKHSTVILKEEAEKNLPWNTFLVVDSLSSLIIFLLEWLNEQTYRPLLFNWKVCKRSSLILLLKGWEKN